MSIYFLLGRNIYGNPLEVIGPSLLEPLGYQVVGEHISNHMIISEWVIVLV